MQWRGRFLSETLIATTFHYFTHDEPFATRVGEICALAAKAVELEFNFEISRQNRGLAAQSADASATAFGHPTLMCILSIVHPHNDARLINTRQPFSILESQHVEKEHNFRPLETQSLTSNHTPVCRIPITTSTSTSTLSMLCYRQKIA